MRKQLGSILALAALLGGCHSIPNGRQSVDDVVVRGQGKVSGVEEVLATKESPKFLWLMRGVFYDYSLFDRFTLQEDLARVEAYYRQRGYYEARARAGRVIPHGDDGVQVEILVDEGEPVLSESARIDGLQGVPSSLWPALLIAAQSELPRDKPFDYDAFQKAKERLLAALTRSGYAYAKVSGEAEIDLVARRARPLFSIDAGPACELGEVLIEGLGDLPEAPVRRALALRTGRRYSSEELEEAKQAVLDLGVFAAVSLEPQLTAEGKGPRRTVVPVRVKLEPARIRAWRVGFGAELDALKSDVHGLLGWEHRNFFGGLRTFSVNVRPGVVLYPLRLNHWELPNKPLPEGRFKLEFRQPGFLEARTNAILKPQFNVYPLLLHPNPPEGAPVIGYAELQHVTAVNRQFGRIYAELSHNLQVDVPLAYIGTLYSELSNIVLSYPELLLQLDLRNDRVRPRKGAFFGNSLQVAGGPFGGTAADVKVQPEVRTYVPLGRRVTWATRASVGFLWPFNYGDAVRNFGRSSFGDDRTAETRDYQVTFFRGFFSGGPSSNRGYPMRGVSPFEEVQFLTPAAAEAKAANCASGRCRTPTGGFTLWELSTELRIRLSEAISMATFCDASDVSPYVNNIRLTHLHLSCGLGGRYDTPIGPIRLDLGFRVPKLQVIGGLTSDQYEPNTFPFGLPLALALGIGEAY